MYWSLALSGQTATEYWIVAQSVCSCTLCTSAACTFRSQTGFPLRYRRFIVGLQPLLTSTIANRLLGERVVARQWGGLLLGIAGVYLVVQDKATTGGAVDAF